MADPTATDRPKSRSLRPLRALLPYLAPHRAILLLALVALLVASAAMLALPVALRYLIDEGMAAGSSDTINRYFVAFLAAAAVFGVFAALRFYFVTWLGERVVADLRSAVYDRVIRMDPAFFEVTRTGEVLSRLTADTTLVQSIAGVNLSITLRSIDLDRGQPGDAGGDQPEAHGNDRGADPVADRAADRARAAGAQPVARLAGPDRRHQRARRRDAERDPDRAGLHARGPEQPALRRGRRGLVPRRRATHQSALDADRDRHDADLRRHHVRAVGRRARGDSRRDDRRAAEPVPAVRGVRRRGRRVAQRDVGRGAARRGRHGAAGRAAAGRAAHRRAARTRCRCRHRAAARSASSA